jgi:hypothetical protein
MTQIIGVYICVYIACRPISQATERIGRGERIRTSGLLVPNQAL